MPTIKYLFCLVAALTLAARLPVLSAADTAQIHGIPHVALGAEIRLEDYLVPGKTVVFDFTSPFCGPCRQIAPYLERFQQEQTDVVVVAVDINRPKFKGIDWQSPVARQYGIESVPQFRIFGPDGKLVAEGKEAGERVLALIGFSWPEN